MEQANRYWGPTTSSPSHTPSPGPDHDRATRLATPKFTFLPPTPMTQARSPSPVGTPLRRPKHDFHVWSKAVPDGARKGETEEHERRKRARSNSLDDSIPAQPLSLAVTRVVEVNTSSTEYIPVLPAPLPSKRAKKNGTWRTVLLPVNQLPVFALPPLPPILDEEITKQVFTHSSLFRRQHGVFEEPDGQDAKHYEKLEHVGDSILGMIVTTWLHELRPGLTCGSATVSKLIPYLEADMQKLKAHLVSNATLSHISGMYNFPQRLNGDPRLLPLLRVQTDVRAALVEAYIAGIYFSYPPEQRLTEGIAVITAWLREMYDPLYDFFFKHMKAESIPRITLSLARRSTGWISRRPLKKSINSINALKVLLSYSKCMASSRSVR